MTDPSFAEVLLRGTDTDSQRVTDLEFDWKPPTDPSYKEEANPNRVSEANRVSTSNIGLSNLFIEE